MAIIGWILWGIGFFFAILLFFTAAKEIRGEAPPFQRNLEALSLELLTLVSIVISLYITTEQGVSKLHLLWLIPGSFGVALISVGLFAIIYVKLYYHRKIERRLSKIAKDISEKNS